MRLLGPGEAQQKLIRAFGDSLTFETSKYAKACNRFGLTPGVILDIRNKDGISEMKTID